MGKDVYKRQVQTYVIEQDDELIQDIIRRELDRGGQVYVCLLYTSEIWC